MTKRIFILAAGEGQRWAVNGADVPAKQLVPFKGEPLILRTLNQIERLFGSHLASPEVVVVARRNEIREVVRPPAWVFFPLEFDQAIDTLASTEPLWMNRNVVLLGDVLYTDAALEKIVNCPDRLQFFGSMIEIYGLTFVQHVTFWDALNRVRFDARHGGPGKLGTFYNAYCNQPFHMPYRDEFFTFITDKTRDLDRPDDYELALRDWGFVK